jgi:hypothetical protein
MEMVACQWRGNAALPADSLGDVTAVVQVLPSLLYHLGDATMLRLPMLLDAGRTLFWDDDSALWDEAFPVVPAVFAVVVSIVTVSAVVVLLLLDGWVEVL